MRSFHARSGAGELLARYSFVEPLLQGRRVLELGAAGSTAGESARLLAGRGAAEVLSVEPDEATLAPALAEPSPPQVRFRAGEPASLPEGAFDLVLLADGASLAGAPERAAALRRLLAPGGRLVTAIDAGGAGLAELAGEPRGAAPPAYPAFASALAAEFACVEVATQAATVGWVFGLAADGDPAGAEPEVALDGSLAGAPETATYVAVCGEAPSGLRGLTLVALPAAPLLAARAGLQAARSEGQAARDAVEAALRRAERAEGEAERLRAELGAEGELRAAAEAELEATRSGADASAAQASGLEAELQSLRWEKEELEQRLESAAGAAAGSAQASEVERLREEIATRAGENAILSKEVERLEAVVRELTERPLPRGADGAVAEPARGDLEVRLAEALRRAADAEAAAVSARAAHAPLAGGEPGEPLRRAAQQREVLLAQVAERDAKIALLQREVADKTDRLGRLAKEMGELKARGLGKIFR